ncbi:MAG TPA: GGDEF domain-containing protein [Burkholderiales bacterium]|nr:GGDEF domain-containing protein [Burkholderiales bacterium]
MIEPALAWQVALMGVEAAIAAALLLFVFSLRGAVGFAPLYTSVGVLYYLATLLAGSTFVRITADLLVSPGSVALFPAALFAVLLVYIKEDAREARNMIYGLLAANVLAALLGIVVSRHLSPGPHTLNPYDLPAALFVQSPRLFLFGLLALFADAILIILVYEAFARRVRSLFFRAWASLAVVLAFDTVVFVTGGFVENPAYGTLLLSAMLGKVSAAGIYAAALALYLKRAETKHVAPGLKDLFQVLTYRQKYEALQAQASRDPLTGVRNRGHFDEQLRTLVDAGEPGTPTTVMMVDVDHFKRINDSHGHAEGDRALRVIAQALAASLRSTDHVCRYGGEEFGILLPGTPLAAAEALAARIREEVPAACARAGVCEGMRITVTIGLAACPSDGRESDAVLRAADRRLYRGKAAGRDRVIAA